MTQQGNRPRLPTQDETWPATIKDFEDAAIATGYTFASTKPSTTMQITIDIDEEELSALSNISSITFITPDRHQKRFTDVLSVVEKVSNAVEATEQNKPS